MEKVEIYIVDDEKIILEGLVKTYPWEKWGAEVTGFSINPVTAADEIRALSPDIVITDIRMKQMTGLELMEMVKPYDESIYWIIISAYRDFDYAKDACSLGALRYLLKPVDDEELEQALLEARESIFRKKKEKKIIHQYENFVKNNKEVLDSFWMEKDQGTKIDDVKYDGKDYILQALSYIQENLADESLNIGMVAQNVHLNPAYFGRLFNQRMQMSFKQYLLGERIKIAKKLLRETDDTVVEIGEKIGIPNPSYFASQFKEKVGSSPTDYRKSEL